MTQKISLFNKGKRTIKGKHKDGTPYALPPQLVGRFDAEHADKLRRLFPGEVVSLEDMHKQFEAAVPREEQTDDAAPASSPPAETPPPPATPPAEAAPTDEAPAKGGFMRGLLGGKKAPAAGEGDNGTDGDNAGQADTSGQGNDAA